MKRIKKKREVVKGNGLVEVQESWLKDFVEVEEGQVLGQLRGELFNLFKLLIENTMQLELEAMLGYAPHQKKGNGVNSRNGYRERNKLVLKEGLLEGLRVPRDRNGEYQTEVLPRLKRYEPAILDYVQQLYLNYNSTRPLSGMLTTLFGWPMSHGQVSNFCQVLDKEVEEWKKRPLADIYVGLFLDAVWPLLPFFFFLRRFNLVLKMGGKNKLNNSV